ncbi:Gfo/Idh/MocA family oxidoreductase [bacterium]|nr:Gfo/Idh/MocA family oxidoreductase [bacterium]
MNRRKFIHKAGTGAAALGATGPWVTQAWAKKSPNDTINIAIMGIHGRGMDHVQHYMNVPNVEVAMLCDIDERLFPDALKKIAELGAKPPKTETDIRRVLENKDIDVISIACPNHWHALAGVWACQAGKDVYVEKPASHTVYEGRKLVEASRKYDRIVQTGSQRRSDPLMQEAVDFIQSGKLGKIYMVKACVYRARKAIGRGTTGPVPEGVHYDLFRGPAPWIPFNDNRFHYNWHWFWDTGNGETGNNGPHPADIVRWALNKYDHPRTIQSMGGLYVYDSEQETPNTQISVMEYADGTMVQLEVRNHYTNTDGTVREGIIFYGSEGWMQFNLGNTWTTFFGPKNEPGPSMTREEANTKTGIIISYGRGREPHFNNFIDCVRSRKREDLKADIVEGHLSAAICHLSNIAYRTGRTLTFDSESERFLGDEDANRYLTREYRYPYVMPENV